MINSTDLSAQVLIGFDRIVNGGVYARGVTADILAAFVVLDTLVHGCLSP